MLTHEENDLLVRVGPGTPGGELLRRYWHPIALAQDLSDENPTKFVRVLGEDLVLFRDKSGNTGLIADKCPHRSASMVYGRVEERGISCAYHGWLMDCDGNIIETPPERNDAIMKNVTTTAYPVQIYLNLIWTYMGPQPVPPMTRYDTLFRKDGHRSIRLHPQLDCNWFQAMENSMDPAHLQVLHQEFIAGGRDPVNTTRGFTDDVESFEFFVTEFGLMKKRTYKNGTVDEHPLV
ncbi:MAG: Rieske 2Fe-2S domain-containing protein, partial [Chloroflexi bacterium]|nr:Rieske 2Fe-2S domain-containing protein [Chloroflexota bacterium]